MSENPIHRLLAMIAMAAGIAAGPLHAQEAAGRPAYAQLEWAQP